MINAEKFEKVFGYKPDTECCVLECEQFANCPFFEELDGGCRCDSWWFQEYKENGQNSIIKEDKHMSNLQLSSPWVIYAKKVQELFNKDPQIHFEYINDTPELKIYVDDVRKADAIGELLPYEKSFGNVSLRITIIPSNVEEDRTSLIRDAFRDNPIVDHINRADVVGGGSVTFVSFVKEVVQFFDDDMSDENGYCSTLYQELAKEVLGEKGEVYFCTALD